MAALGFDRLDVSDLFGSSNLAIDRSRDHRRCHPDFVEEMAVLSYPIETASTRC